MTKINFSARKSEIFWQRRDFLAQRRKMMKSVRASAVGLAVAIVVVGGIFMTARPANAVVYCRAEGVPHGCVARSAVAVHPVVVHGPVVYCKRVGVPKGCVMR